jgi:hypothetical protein
VPVTFTGYFGAGPAVSIVPVGLRQDTLPTPFEPARTASSPRVSTSGGEGASIGLSIVIALAWAFTVKDIWREWQEGLVG